MAVDFVENPIPTVGPVSIFDSETLVYYLAPGKLCSLKQKLKFYPAYIWLLLGLIAVGIKMATESRPEWIETYYANGLYQYIRLVFDYSLAFFPFPAIYLFLIIFLIILGDALYDLYQNYKRRQLSFSRSLRKFSGFVGGLVFFFFLSWGLNYNRVAVEDHMELKMAPLSLSELRAELETETKELIELRKLISTASDSALTRSDFPEDLEIHLRENLAQTLSRYNYPAESGVRGRLLYPKGIFLRFSSAGLYFPFTGEGHIDAGLHPIQWPYIMSHEMSHGFGFADEGTCNFLAYLSSTSSPHPAVAYAGHLSYWRTLAIQYLQYEPEAYKQFRSGLPPGILADLKAINRELDKYPDLAPNLQPAVYDLYLKSQGIHEGMLNYNRVIMLVHAWRNARKS